MASSGNASPSAASMAADVRRGRTMLPGAGGNSPDYDVTMFSIGFRYSLSDPAEREKVLYKLQ